MVCELQPAAAAAMEAEYSSVGGNEVECYAVQRLWLGAATEMGAKYSAIGMLCLDTAAAKEAEYSVVGKLLKNKCNNQPL